MTIPNIGDNITIAKRKLNVFFLLDTSGSMAGDRIAKLNQAIPVTIEALKKVQEDDPRLRILINVIEFSDDVRVATSPNGDEIDSYSWRDLSAGGYTATASAIKKLCEYLDLERMPRRGYPPVCVLVSDGYCTDSEEAYDDAINRLNKEKWGRKAARIVVSIGDDIDEGALRRFVNKHGSYINCENVEEIIEYIKTKTTEATLTNSESSAMPKDEPTEPNDAGTVNGIDVDALTDVDFDELL